MEWIKVEDELPKTINEPQTMLVLRGYYHHLAYYDEEEGKWYCNSDSTTKIKDITHWMQLPKPPNE